MKPFDHARPAVSQGSRVFARQHLLDAYGHGRTCRAWNPWTARLGDRPES